MQVSLYMMFLIHTAVLALAAVAQLSTQTCPPLPARDSPPASITDLRIDDIKVISALGDSITTGYAAKPMAASGKNRVLLTDLVEYTGVSYATGGDDGAASIGNFAKTFQPNLVGESVGHHIVPFMFGQYTSKKDRFNAAKTGDEIDDLSDQISWLQDEMKETKAVDFANDYKLMQVCAASAAAATALSPLTFLPAQSNPIQSNTNNSS